MRKFLMVSAVAMTAALMVPGTMPAPAQAQGISIQIGSPRFAPPAPRVERRAARPYRGAIWMNGNWRWNGSRYTWVSGRWDRPRAGFNRWEDGRWVQRGRNWIWLEGRWR